MRQHVLDIMLLAAVLGLAVNLPQAHAQIAGDALDRAIAQGVVNWRIDPQWPATKDVQLGLLQRLHPGLVYKIGLRTGWGQVDEGTLKSAGDIAGLIKAKIPDIMLGIGIGESVKPGLDVTLDCGGVSRRFIAAHMTNPRKPLLGGTAWVDVSTDAGRDFYECQARKLIDSGYSLINPDGGGLVIKNAASPQKAVENFNRVFAGLKTYARSIGRAVYISGDVDMLHDGVDIDAAYLPSRFYHVTIPQYRKYQNKVSRPGVGVGYSYVLSPRIVADFRFESSSRTRLFFYVDNWDPAQDDLRRLMELDGVNRRFLIVESAKTAHANGAYFIPSLNHCDGCIPSSVIGDRCELTPGRSDRTEYDAVRCEDESAIEEALDRESPSRVKPRERNASMRPMQDDSRPAWRTYWNATSVKLRSLRECNRPGAWDFSSSSARRPISRCWPTRCR